MLGDSISKKKKGKEKQSILIHSIRFMEFQRVHCSTCQRKKV